MSSPFTEAEAKYLRSQHLGRLATVDARNAPQNNPVTFWIDEEHGTIDIGGLSLGATRKFRNLKDNDGVALVVDDLVSVQPWKVRGLEIRGRAEALTGITPPNPYMSPELIRIHPETIFSWGGIEPGEDGLVKRVVGS